jgi:hypothetical protein
MENYAGFIEHADEGIGRPLAYLKANSQYQYKNTGVCGGLGQRRGTRGRRHGASAMCI